jgi:uncharacterized protein
MGFSQWVADTSNRFLDRMRHNAAFGIGEADAVEGPFESLRGRQYATLVTFRRNGAAVPSPLWFGLDDEGRFYSHTMADGGKVKRLRNDPRVLLVASTRRGKPIGPVYRGLAREVPAEEEAHAEAAMAANYGLGRKLFMATSGQEDIGVYLEVTPLPSSG